MADGSWLTAVFWVWGVSYLYGAIPFALVFTYLSNGKNITQHGSGNVGVINSYAVGGVATIAFTILGEISKAAVAIALATRLGDGSLFMQYTALLAAFLGTNFSLFLKGKGGKGSTLFFWGQAFIVYWIPIVIGLIAAALYLGSGKRVWLKRLWVVAIPPVFYLATFDLGYVVYGLISAALIVLRTNKKNDDYQVHGFLPGRSNAGDETYIKHLSECDETDGIGGKARQLRLLSQHGIPTPQTHVCLDTLYALYQTDPRQAIDELETSLGTFVIPGQRYAARSSANIEDGEVHSFAGQFDSYLNLSGVPSIRDAVVRVWQSASSDRVKAYCESNGIFAEQITMSVLIQPMVKPILSGVAFSHNPLNGLQEIVVEAVEGQGDQLVQGTVTPERWIKKWGAWIDKPEASEFDEDALDKVAALVDKTYRLHNAPIDTEWVYDGTHVVLVQMRDMTGVDSINFYSNKLSKEFLPGAIKPLIWSVNIPLVNSAWVRMITEVIGPNDIDPESLAKSFFYRSYFNMGAMGRIFERLGFPPDGVEILAGVGGDGPDKPAFKPTARTWPLAPRMISCTVDKLRFAKKVNGFLASADDTYQTFNTDMLADLSDAQLLGEIDRLYETNLDAAYFNVVTPLLNLAYHAGLNRKLKPLGLTIDDLQDYVAATSTHSDDPNHYLEQLHAQYQEMPQDLKDSVRVEKSKALTFVAHPKITDFKKQLDAFVAQFGHFSDNGNDFSVKPWREDLDLIVDMVVNFSKLESRSDRKLSLQNLPFKGLNRVLVHWLFNKSLEFKHLRDQVSSTYTYGYGLFRHYFLELGTRFVERGHIEAQEDIFYLSLNEIRGIIHGGEVIEPACVLTQKRRREMDKYSDVDSVLPRLIYGDAPPVLRDRTSNIMDGLPTSGGIYTGSVCVVKGIQDFSKVREGDVLVVPYSDVGWTPLFAKAGAIIAESGGMLSHSSIVAREYNIPAVVSVDSACRLEDGTMVTVDGSQGLVRIDEAAKSTIHAPII